jgi:hypothetical protein
MRIVKRTILWVLGIAALAAILGSPWLAWETRRAAIPNIYQATGVWGCSSPKLYRYNLLPSRASVFRIRRPFDL